MWNLQQSERKTICFGESGSEDSDSIEVHVTA